MPNNLTSSIPIGTRSLYNNVVSIYLSLVSKGVNPLAALDLVNQKVAEKGWTGYTTGDNKKFNNVDLFTDHLIDWHNRMYPGSLKANNFNEFWRGIQITPKHPYNPRNSYKQELLRTRPGVKKRINFYRQQRGLKPLTLNYKNNITYALKGTKVHPKASTNIDVMTFDNLHDSLLYAQEHQNSNPMIFTRSASLNPDDPNGYYEYPLLEIEVTTEAPYKDPNTGKPVNREEYKILYRRKYGKDPELDPIIYSFSRYNQDGPKERSNYARMIQLGFIPEYIPEKNKYVYHYNTKSKADIYHDNPKLTDNRYYKQSLKEADFITQCAKAANRLNYNLGRPTQGNAWTRQGVYGDKVIWTRPSNYKYTKSERRHFLSMPLEDGDIVDIHMPVSIHQEDADLYGRGNSHTGTIVLNPITGEKFLVHNVGGNVESISLREFMDKNEGTGKYIMRITRPLKKK